MVPSFEGPSGSRWHILLVDDEPDILSSMATLLDVCFPDAFVSTANSGPAALEHLEDHHVDLVVSDFRMPGMDGLELLMEVRRRWPDTARVILSAFNLTGVEDRSVLEQVANAIYSKSEAPERLMAHLHQLRDGITG